MPKTCPKPRRTPCDGAWPHEKDDCCYKRLPKESGTGTSRKASTSSKSKKPTMNDASKAARKIVQSAMKKATQGPTVADLRADAKAKKIRGFSRMTKAQLMQALGKSGSATPSTKGNASVSTKSNASVSAKGNASPAKGTTSVSAKASTASANGSSSSQGSSPVSVSPMWMTFIQKSWNNLANDDSGRFSSKTKMVMSESTLRFVAKRVLRNIKDIGSGVKTAQALEKGFDKFERVGTERAARYPAMKAMLRSYDGGVLDALREDAEERTWTYSEFGPKDLENDYSITRELLDYVVSLFPGLEGVPPSKSKSIAMQLLAIAQIMVEALADAAIRKRESGKQVEVSVTEEAIETKAKEDAILFLFYM